MDPLSLTASIIAVVELANEIAGACMAYIEGVKGYPKDLRLIYSETKSLTGLFESLRFLDEDDADDAGVIRHIRGRDGPVEGCKAAIQELLKLIPPSTGSNRPVLDKLSWPLKAPKAEKILKDLKLHKSTTSMAMEGAILCVPLSHWVFPSSKCYC
jgi:hypothetical protein